MGRAAEGEQTLASEQTGEPPYSASGAAEGDQAVTSEQADLDPTSAQIAERAAAAATRREEVAESPTPAAAPDTPSTLRGLAVMTKAAMRQEAADVSRAAAMAAGRGFGSGGGGGLADRERIESDRASHAASEQRVIEKSVSGADPVPMKTMADVKAPVPAVETPTRHRTPPTAQGLG